MNEEKENIIDQTADAPAETGAVENTAPPAEDAKAQKAENEAPAQDPEAQKAAEKEAAKAAKAAEKERLAKEREEAKAAKAAEKEAAAKEREAQKAARAAEKEAAKAARAAEKEAKAQERAAQKAARPAPDTKKLRKVFKAVALTFVVVLTLAAIATAGLAMTGRRILNSDKIFPGVTVGDIPVGGLTKDEAVAALEVKGWVEDVGGTLNVSLPLDTGFQIDYLESGASLTPEKAAAAAYRFGRGGGVVDALKAYWHGRNHTTDVSVGEAALDPDYIRQRLQDGIAQFERATADQGHHVDRVNSTITLLKGAGEMKIDEEDLFAAVVAALEARQTELDYEPTQMNVSMPDFDDMHEQLAVEPRNASYDPLTDTIEPEVVGVDFDVEQARALWEAAAPGEEYAIPVTLTYPTVTEESMQQYLFRDLLGERTTSFWGSTDNRVNNIELVAQKLNGHVILPGEEFSYNGYVGERTVEAGFKSADAYVNGQVRPEIGGGICQVSSTLYNAVLGAQLEIVERTGHMFAVGYLPKGLDATVSWPAPDFKFRNNRDYPVRLAAWVDRENTNLTIQVWGSNLDGTYGVPKSSWGKRFDKDWLERGYEVQIGWDAYSWLEIYAADGTYLEKRKLYNSYYALHDEDIVYPEIPEEPAAPDPVIIVPDTPAVVNPDPPAAPDPVVVVPTNPDPPAAPDPVVTVPSNPDPDPGSSGGGETGGGETGGSGGGETGGGSGEGG